MDATSYDDAAERVLQWARAGESRRVAVATVHTVMEAHDDHSFRALLAGADLVTPDGMPLVWSLRALGVPGATRVYGPDLTLELCHRAGLEGIPVGFYGGSPKVVRKLAARLTERFPELRIAYAYSPPFRRLTDQEDAAVVDAIASSEVRVLFVGLGAPKQDEWAAEHQGRVPAVMVGVGAAFDFLAGDKRQAPRWMQNAGLEWVFRLSTEPKRLWRRYLHHNPRFVWLFARQLVLARR